MKKEINDFVENSFQTTYRLVSDPTGSKEEKILRIKEAELKAKEESLRKREKDIEGFEKSFGENILTVQRQKNFFVLLGMVNVFLWIDALGVFLVGRIQSDFPDLNRLALYIGVTICCLFFQFVLIKTLKIFF